MEDGEGLFVLAAVVIAFVNWLSTTLKQRAAKRELEKRRARGEVIEPEPIVEEEEEAWADPEPTALGQAGAPDKLRAFFESLQQPTTTPPPPPPREEPIQPVRQAAIPSSRKTAQEPARWKAPEVKRVQLSAAESKALENLTELKVTQTTSSRGSLHPIAQKLRKEGGAREAILLSEILGKPKALSKG